MNSPITTQSSLPVWRRKGAWLALILALGILCLAAIPPALSGEGTAGSSEARLEGSWLVTVTFGDGTPSLESPVSFTADGVMIGSQPSTPDFLSTPWHGTWTKTGRREFIYKAMAFQYDNTVKPGVLYRIMLKEALTIAPDGDTYNSTSSSVEGFGPNGEHWGPTAGDTTHAVRIKAE